MIQSFRIVDNLPFVEIRVSFKGNKITLINTLIDTGSSGTILNADIVREIGIKPEPEDPIGSIRGVGGMEFVYIKPLDWIQLGDSLIKDFKVDIGDMDYGFAIDGILGMDFWLRTKLAIDFDTLQIKQIDL
jgi:predicted aspartyl protease